jgi:hypothetical protein
VIVIQTFRLGTYLSRVFSNDIQFPHSAVIIRSYYLEPVHLRQ